MQDQFEKAVMNVISFLEVNDSNLEKVASFIHLIIRGFCLSICLSVCLLQLILGSGVCPSCLIILSHLWKLGTHYHVHKVQPLILN
jgi:hypothetical protein